MKRFTTFALLAVLAACNNNPQPSKTTYSAITLPGGASAVQNTDGTIIAAGDIIVGNTENLQAAANEYSNYFESDLSSAGHGAPVHTRLWAGNVIPYTINANLAAKYLPLIDQAVQEYASKSKVRLVKRSTQKYFVEIAGAANPDFCGLASSIGFYSTNTVSRADRTTYGLSRSASHFIILNNNAANIPSDATCAETARTVIHEFGHILGLRHEQSRPDRDSFIRIDTTALNNDPLYVSAYTYKYGTDGRLNNYDLSSVMHYRAIFRKTGLQAIFPIQDPSYPVNQIGGDTISAGDIQMIQTLYPNAPQ